MQITRLPDNRFDEFFKLVQAMVSEAEFHEAVPNKDIIWKTFKHPTVATFVAIKDDKIIGFIAGVIGPYFFSTKKRVSDIGFYVIPEYRGSRAALKLLAALEGWAKENKITDVCIGQTTAVNIEKTQQFYNRLGYNTVGFNTIKHLEI